LYISGETLEIQSYDVSLKGIKIEILSGNLLTEISDFKALIKENNEAEIYVKELELTGDVFVIWANQEDGKIILGLEFRDVKYKAEKLWRKRKFYRSKKPFVGYMMLDDRKIDFHGFNVSADGLALQVERCDQSFEPGSIIEFFLNDFDLKGLGKVIWVNACEDESCILGLQYLTMK
jgi:hypothetical protein